MRNSYAVFCWKKNATTQLNTTYHTLSQHYALPICNKPNNVKAQGTFASHQVMQQLRYSGVLEVVRIRREAFPTREDFRAFYAMFKILAWGKGWPEPEDATDAQAREFAEIIAKESLPEEAFQMGHNKLFLRHYGLESMRQAVQIGRAYV